MQEKKKEKKSLTYAEGVINKPLLEEEVSDLNNRLSIAIYIYIESESVHNSDVSLLTKLLSECGRLVWEALVYNDLQCSP